MMPLCPRRLDGTENGVETIRRVHREVGLVPLWQLDFQNDRNLRDTPARIFGHHRMMGLAFV